MLTIRDIAEDIVTREGGFVDDPDDPGGVTKYGVTLKTLRRLGLDTTGDGLVSLQDLKSLSRDQAVEIFIHHYFEAPGVSTLPVAIQASVFDMYVNAGANAVRILQSLLRQMGYSLQADGVIGPQTEASASDAAAIDTTAFRDAYGIARRNYYFRVADRRSASRKYARTRAGGKGGWILRAEAFMSPHYHLSKESFAKRVAQWQ
ncbi:holin-associated N-acetylmuramidase [Pseudophaeobacter sp.]|uniref:holin-associated N-acetylmuramidase n=1 Tax=Pseudophaeobacter sp. TaxID=1971739 RepID=UPI00329818F5